jgi:LysM repeat protein
MATTRSQAKPRVSLVARVLAPLALIAVVVGLFIVISGSMSSSDGGGGRHARHGDGGHAHHSHQSTPDTYVVQQDDTLDGIAAKTHVSVEDLQRLNPDVDTQALVPGSTLKLH